MGPYHLDPSKDPQSPSSTPAFKIPRYPPQGSAIPKLAPRLSLVNIPRACLVNRLVPRRGREKGEKNPKAVGDELQKRPRHEARSPAAPPLEEGGRKVAR